MTAQLLWLLIGLIVGCALTVSAGIRLLKPRFVPVAKIEVEKQRADRAEAAKAASDKDGSDFRQLCANLEQQLQTQTELTRQAQRDKDILAVKYEIADGTIETLRVERDQAVAKAADAESRRRSARRAGKRHERAARHLKGEHAFHKNLSQSRLEENENLRAWILDFDRRLSAAESRAARNEAVVRHNDFVKDICAGKPVPRIPRDGESQP